MSSFDIVRVRCSFCGKGFSRSDDVKRHIRQTSCKNRAAQPVVSRIAINPADRTVGGREHISSDIAERVHDMHSFDEMLVDSTVDAMEGSQDLRGTFD
jgi:hypothetical protein